MEKYNKNRDILIKRLLFMVVVFLLFLTALDKVSVSIIFGIIILASVYAFLRENIWLLLIVTVPSLIFGKVLFIPITPGWIYEAHLAEILLGLVFAVYFLDIFLNQNYQKIKIDKLGIWLFIYLALSLFSIVEIADIRLFVFGLKAIAFSFAGYFLAINLLDSTKKIYWFIYSLLLTSIFLSIQIFFKFYQMGFSSDFFFNRSNILLPIGPIATTAAMLALLAPLALAFYLELDSSSKWKPVALFSFLFSFVAIFLTLGKGAIVSLFIGLLFLFYNLKNKRLAFFIFLAWFIAFAYFGFTPYFTGLLERMQNVFVDTNTDFRVTEYKIGWELIQKNPEFGVGIGQQIYHYKKILDQEQGNYVNNFFLQALIDLGVLGFMVLIFIIKNIFNNIKKYWKTSKHKSIMAIGFISSFLVAFANGLVEVTFFALSYAIIFWMMMGAFSNIKNLEIEKKKLLKLF